MTPERGIGILVAMVMVLGSASEWHRTSKARDAEAQPAAAVVATTSTPGTAIVADPRTSPGALVAMTPAPANDGKAKAAPAVRSPAAADTAGLTALRLSPLAPTRAPAIPATRSDHDG